MAPRQLGAIWLAAHVVCLEAAAMWSTRTWPIVRRAPPCMSARPLRLPGLRKEALRRLERGYKKLSKAEERAVACEERQATLLAEDNPALDDLEALPNCEALRQAAAEQLAEVEELQKLSDGLHATSSAEDPGFVGLAALAERLGVGDEPPPRPPPKKKAKGPRPSKAPRVPYRTYRVTEGAEVRVGRTAADNDQLSCDPAHRDGRDWWLHAAGCAGSHVVVRAGELGDDLPAEVAMDAAVLAARYSKAPQSGVASVNLCRARQVSKPAGAKPGLVQLSGDVRTLRVEWRREKQRLERLEADFERAQPR